MQSRRSFLRVASTGVVAAAAGCASNPLTGERTGTWREETPMPVAQSDVASGVVDGKLYCFGGIRSDRYLDATKEGFVYDPADGEGGSWSRMPDLPKPLWGQCGVSDGERIFAFGGAGKDSPYQTHDPPTDEIFVFEPGDGWTNLTETTGARCPYLTWVMQGVYNPHDGLIYNVGGAVYQYGNYADEHDEVWTFDPETGEVVDAPLTTLPTKRRWATVGLLEVDGSPVLHVAGGQSDGPERANDRYDIAADEWIEAAPLPKPGNFGANYDPVIDNKLYLTHGLIWESIDDLSNDSYKLVCWEYDPVADEWNTNVAKPSFERSGGAADGVIDGTLYVAGGHRKDYDGNNFHQATNKVESFSPESDEG